MGFLGRLGRRRKVRLPTDCHGVPINVDDYMMFDDGIVKIQSLTYCGERYGWLAETDEKGEIVDNLSGGKVMIW